MLHFVRYGEDNFMIYLYDSINFIDVHIVSLSMRVLFNLNFHIYKKRERELASINHEATKIVFQSPFPKPPINPDATIAGPAKRFRAPHTP